ncbi:hypothetical protein [uncultured Muribaculum sp.]|uniref:hypothetical protein n=1 Tax=uncultured Muribaculum sp. TaxID=1918613 RepID=UPI0025FA1A14|nr:hypothetical protein [uncultured Muribaculum sp.]
MANKRNLKKAVKAVCGNIAGECIISRNLIPGIDVEKMNEAVLKVADLQYVTIANTSFSFDKTPKSFENTHDYRTARDKYFRKAYTRLAADFNKGIEDVVALMNSALPADRKATEA